MKYIHFRFNDNYFSSDVFMEWFHNILMIYSFFCVTIYNFIKQKLIRENIIFWLLSKICFSEFCIQRVLITRCQRTSNCNPECLVKISLFCFYLFFSSFKYFLWLDYKLMANQCTHLQNLCEMSWFILFIQRLI